MSASNVIEVGIKPEIAAALELLKANGYRFTSPVLEKSVYHEGTPEGKLLKALIVDVEATGKDTLTDKMIEIGAVLVEYDSATGYIHQVLDTVSELEDPEMPISEGAFKVHGISQEMVAGQKFSDKTVELAKQSNVVVCHNSDYDRKMLEKRFPIFETKPFACSLRNVAWLDEGFMGAKLEYILYSLGKHYEGHRAINDCFALIEALSCTLPVSNKGAFLAMMENVRLLEVDIAALNTPFDSKDTLKANGYKWFDDGQGVKYWHKSLKEADVEAEVEWLKVNVYGEGRKFTLQHTEIDAYVRFSKRDSTKISKISY